MWFWVLLTVTFGNHDPLTGVVHFESLSEVTRHGLDHRRRIRAKPTYNQLKDINNSIYILTELFRHSNFQLRCRLTIVAEKSSQGGAKCASCNVG